MEEQGKLENDLNGAGGWGVVVKDNYKLPVQQQLRYNYTIFLQTDIADFKHCSNC